MNSMTGTAGVEILKEAFILLVIEMNKIIINKSCTHTEASY